MSRPRALALPSASRSRAKASTVSISGAVAAMLEHAANSALVPLGCAVPDPALLQSKRLGQPARAAPARHALQRVLRALRRTGAAPRNRAAGHALRASAVRRRHPRHERLHRSVDAALNAVATRGDTIAVESPTYFGLLHTLEALGLKALELPTDPLRGVDVGLLAAARIGIDRRLRAVVELRQSARLRDERGRQAGAARAAHAPPGAADRRRRLRRHPLRPGSAAAVQRTRQRCRYDLLQFVLEEPRPGYRIGWIAAGARTQQVMERKLALSLCGPCCCRSRWPTSLRAAHTTRICARPARVRGQPG